MTRSRRLLISTCVLAAALAAQAPPTSPMELVDVALPSESAAVGGTLALRLLAPRTGRAFFPEGAPVVVHVPGGFELGGLASANPQGLNGFVNVRFLFPGGSDQNGASGGKDD